MKPSRRKFIIGAGIMAGFYALPDYATCKEFSLINNSMKGIKMLVENPTIKINYKTEKDVNRAKSNIYSKTSIIYTIEVIEQKTDSILKRMDIIQPVNLNITLVKNKRELAKSFFDIYRRKKNYIAFYSPSKDMIYLSAWHLTRAILAHEITHVKLEAFFNGKMPGRMQEIICQEVERRF